MRSILLATTIFCSLSSYAYAAVCPTANEIEDKVKNFLAQEYKLDKVYVRVSLNFLNEYKSVPPGLTNCAYTMEHKGGTATILIHFPDKK